MRKFALLSYTGSTNIGDEIQSVAAAQHLPHIDATVEREFLKDNRELSVILNGWFMHNPACWPPPANIDPLFVSFHITPSAAERMMSDESLLYLRKHEPIGCRDLYTRNLLRKHGVRAFFSACLTLTLQKSAQLERSGVYIVDIDPRAPFSEALRRNAVFMSHIVKPSRFTERLTMANRLLRVYQGAELVITSRLHAALPCLAYGTPVIFVARGEDPRFTGLSKLLRTCRLDQVLQSSYPIDLSPASGPADISLYQRLLTRRCAKFVGRNSGDFVNVATAVDRNYLKHLSTLLHSIYLNTDRPVRMHVLERGLSAEEKAEVVRLPGIDVKFINMDSAFSHPLTLTLLSHTTISTLDRLFLTSLLPEVGKLIYLDCDLVVNSDLKELLAMRTSEKGVAAKPSLHQEYSSISAMLQKFCPDVTLGRDVSFSPGATAFNAGVLVLDLNKMRKHHFQEYALRLVECYGLNDQAVLNLYCNGEFEPLPPSWNVFVGQDWPEQRNIVHWAGVGKPWQKDREVFGREYWDAYDISL